MQIRLLIQEWADMKMREMGEDPNAPSARPQTRGPHVRELKTGAEIDAFLA